MIKHIFISQNRSLVQALSLAHAGSGSGRFETFLSDKSEGGHFGPAPMKEEEEEDEEESAMRATTKTDCLGLSPRRAGETAVKQPLSLLS